MADNSLVIYFSAYNLSNLLLPISFNNCPTLCIAKTQISPSHKNGFFDDVIITSALHSDK